MLSDLDKKIVRELQQDLPLVPRPYKVIAEKLGLTEAEFLKKINFFKEKGYIRRIGAALRHRKIGLTVNPMIVMRVLEKELDTVGKKIASFPQVTHCYNRPPAVDFPYNLYAMIHCESKEESETLVQEIISFDAIKDYTLLYSTRELKKTSMKYFLD